MTAAAHWQVSVGGCDQTVTKKVRELSDALCILARSPHCRAAADIDPDLNEPAAVFV
jgi:hypothetical protein